MVNTLKDCPFCGGKSNKENRDLNRIYFDTKGGWYWVYCEECGCRTAHAGNEKAAATLWNTRAYEKT